MMMILSCGSCGKPVLWFSKERWTRSGRPRLRQLPQDRFASRTWPARHGIGLARRVCGLLFKGHRRFVIQGGVAAPRVVPSFDEIEHGETRLARRVQRDAIEQFTFERGEEAFAEGIVI